MTSLAIDRAAGALSSAAVKRPCRAASTAALALSGLATVDGVALASGDRVLVKDQADTTKNGIYVASTSTWQRAADFDGAGDAVNGTVAYVTGGTVGLGFWYCTATDPVTFGSSALAFGKASSVLAAVSPYVQTLLDDASAAAARATLGVVGGWDTIGTANASGAASIDFTSGITSAYDHYELRFSLMPGTNAASLWFRTGGGIFKNGVTDYRFERNILAAGANTPGTNTGASQITMAVGLSNVASRTVQGRVRFARPAASGELKYFDWEVDYFDGTALNRASGVGLYQTDGAPLDRVQLFFSSGLVASGQAVLAGLRTN